MINTLTKVIEMFNQEPDIARLGFLSSFFRTPPDGFTDAVEVEYDVLRSGNESAPTVRDLSTGAVTLVEDKFTNKKISFPVYALESPVNIASLMTRRPGESAYIEDRVNWQARLAQVLVRQFTKMTRMVRNSIEEQAAQVLQTGALTLTDENGSPTFELNFKPKPTHFPVTAVSWDESSAEPLEDIAVLSDAIQADGYVDVTSLIFGDKAWKAFYDNAAVREQLEMDSLNMGGLNPNLRNKGAKYMGYLHIGAYRFDLYLYNASYTSWGETNPKRFINPDKVLFLPEESDLDLRRLFGGIPNVREDSVFDPLFGGKIPVGNEYDFRARIYFDEPRETYVGEVKSRPVSIPVSIDRYGCLTAITH
jgi:hypothetical protein